MTSAFRTDIFHSSLKELQKEKAGLEMQLKEIRTKRRNLEHILDNVVLKHAQAKDVNNKMLETSRVAHHMVEQSQRQADSLEEINKGSRKHVKNLNTQIEEQNKKETEEIQLFENELQDITQKLIEAKDFYTKNNLAKVLGEAEERKKVIAVQAIRSKEEMDELSRQVEDMKLLQPALQIPAEQQKVIFELLQDENKKVHETLKEVSSKVQQYQADLQELGKLPPQETAA